MVAVCGPSLPGLRKVTDSVTGCPSTPATSAACKSTGPTAFTVNANTASAPSASGWPSTLNGAYCGSLPSTHSVYEPSGNAPPRHAITAARAGAS